MCCRYFALEIDEPEGRDDFENIRWYLAHEGTLIFVDDGDWYLQIDNHCKFLDEDDRCTIYEKRPEICREYGNGADGEWHCEHAVPDQKHDLELRSMEEVEQYAEKVLAAKAKKKKRKEKKS